MCVQSGTGNRFCMFSLGQGIDLYSLFSLGQGIYFVCSVWDRVQILYGQSGKGYRFNLYVQSGTGCRFFGG